MLKSHFHYHLPEELIAQAPLKERTASRLLSLDGATGEIRDRQFTELTGLLKPGDLLVFNDTKVIPARLFATKQTGGKVELLIERLLSENEVLAQARSSKPLRAGTFLMLDQDALCEVLAREGVFYRLRFDCRQGMAELLDQIGHIPLPPYIKRSDTEEDQQRYQTVYAQKPGAIAAPTAGLHFDQLLIERLVEQGVSIGHVTLHVGSGTFQPVRVDDFDDHVMHKEEVTVSEELVLSINRAKRVIAVGTTSVRALETAAREGEIKPFRGETNLFVQPGYHFNCVDAMVTNFHLPESTLMSLVCAFGGYDRVMRAYRHAVEQRYRFFSYGDAMFMTRNEQAAPYQND